MTFILIIVIVLSLAFGLVLVVGAPYLPTLKKPRKQALELLDLKPGQTLYELGCGDGTLLIEAAKQGLNVVGYELNPLLAFLCWLRSRKYKKQVRVVCGNFWKADLSKADGIYVFLLDRFMPRLDEKIKSTKTNKSIKLVSNAFKVPGRKAVKQGGSMFLYVYD